MHIKNYPSKSNDTNGDMTQQDTRAGTVSNTNTLFGARKSSNATKVSNLSNNKLHTTTASFLLSPKTASNENKDTFNDLERKTKGA